MERDAPNFTKAITALSVGDDAHEADGHGEVSYVGHNYMYESLSNPEVLSLAGDTSQVSPSKIIAIRKRNRAGSNVETRLPMRPKRKMALDK